MELYPSWRYHPDHDPVIVSDPGEEDALGEGWVDSPSKFQADEAQVADPAPFKRRRGRPRKVSP